MLKSDNISTGRAALILGVSARTVLRWGEDGLLGEVTALESGHRRYSRAAVMALHNERLREADDRADLIARLDARDAEASAS